MAFVFEKKRNARGSSVQVEFPAIRITVHKEGKEDKEKKRFYVAMNHRAVKAGRFLKGDKLTIGYDPDSGMLAIRRDNENGFAVVGGTSKNRGFRNAAFQLAIDSKSEITAAIFRVLGVWIPAEEVDAMLIADSYSMKAVDQSPK